MGQTSVQIIKALLALSILFLISIIVLLALTFAYDLSGYNLQLLVPGCSGNNYLNIKLAGLYMILRVHTIVAFIALVVSIIVVILMGKIYCHIGSIDQVESASQQKLISQVQIGALFVLVSLSVLMMVSNGGGNISLYINNKTCTIMDQNKLFPLVIVSLLSLLVAFTQCILVMVLSCMRQDKHSMVNLNDVRQNGELKRQEQAMSKHFQMQAKQYISNNFNKKQGLLQQQYNIYGNIQQAFAQNRRNNQPTQNNNQLLTNNGVGLGNNSNNNGARLNNNSGVGLSNNNPLGLSSQLKNDDRVQVQQNYEDFQIINPIHQQLLHAKNDYDNISEKFDQNNFELEEALQKSMLDQQQDLSPLQLKQLMNLTKNSFNLSSNNKKSLILDRQYQNPNIRVTINFAKIKQHKKDLQRQRDNIEKQPIEEQNIQNNKQDKKYSIQDELNKPINEQVAKLLKITFYNNSNVNQQNYRPIQAQTQCPISKYIKYEDGFEIVQSDDKGKHKKIQYSKEQVIFSKKRQDANEGQQKEKATVRQRFNQSQSIRQDRLSLFGQEWVNQQQRLRKEKEKGQKNKKRKLVEVIRSKYYQ